MMFKLSKANESHFSEIKNIIDALHLDSSHLQINQFCVALKNSKVIGIGRIKTINNCQELCTLGVMEEYRNQGIGFSIVKFLKQNHTLPIYLVTDISEYFIKQGFMEIEEYPEEMIIKQQLCIDHLKCQSPKVMIYK